MTPLPIQPDPPLSPSSPHQMEEIVLATVQGRGVVPAATALAFTGTQLVFDREVAVEEASTVRVRPAWALKEPPPELDRIQWSRREVRILAQHLSSDSRDLSQTYRRAALAAFDRGDEGALEACELNPLSDRAVLEHGSDEDLREASNRLANKGPEGAQAALRSLGVDSYALLQHVLGSPLAKESTSGRAVVFASTPVYACYWSYVGLLRDRPDGDRRKTANIDDALAKLLQRGSTAADFEAWFEGYYPDTEERFGASCPRTALYGGQATGKEHRTLDVGLPDSVLPDRFQSLWPGPLPNLPALAASRSHGPSPHGLRPNDPVIHVGVLPPFKRGADHHATVQHWKKHVQRELDPYCSQIVADGIRFKDRNDSTQDVELDGHADVHGDASTSRVLDGAQGTGLAGSRESQRHIISPALMVICRRAAVRAALAGPRCFQEKVPLEDTAQRVTMHSWAGVPVSQLARVYLRRLLRGSMTSRNEGVDRTMAALAATGAIFGAAEPLVLDGSAAALEELTDILRRDAGSQIEAQLRDPYGPVRTFPRSHVIRSFAWQVLQRFEFSTSMPESKRLTSLYLQLARAADAEPTLQIELTEQRRSIRRTIFHEQTMDRLGQACDVKHVP